jgi:pyruvate,water dikinase
MRRCGAQLDQDIRTAYAKLSAENGGGDVAVAVRSSATAEDLPDASPASRKPSSTSPASTTSAQGQVFASLYNDRAIAYRVHHGFKHEDVFLSAGVQLMVRSDVGASGVLFTLDTESGFRDVVFVTGSYGLGEMVVQVRSIRTSSTSTSRPCRPASRRSCAARSAARRSSMVYSGRPASA